MNILSFISDKQRDIERKGRDIDSKERILYSIHSNIFCISRHKRRSIFLSVYFSC